MIRPHNSAHGCSGGRKIKVFASVFKGSSSLRHRLSRFAERMEIAPAEGTTLMTDGAESLLRLKGLLPLPPRLVLDYFHLSMKVRHVASASAESHPSAFDRMVPSSSSTTDSIITTPSVSQD